MLHTAYCDESEDSRPGGRFYVVSGYLARAKDWVIVDQAWSNALADEGLSEFHMADCEAGRGVFNGFGFAQRAALQRRFIELLVGSPIWGFTSAIQTRHCKQMAQRFQKARGKYAKPYFLAFQHLVEMMALELDDVKQLKADEKIAFVFDRQDEYNGRAREIFASLVRDDDDSPGVNRIGSLTFNSRLKSLPLHCADVLAYENLRYLRDYRHGLAKQVRWQWELLTSSGRVLGRILTREELQEICEVKGW